MAGIVSEVVKSVRAVSKRLFASYVLDWVAMIIFAAIAYAVSQITPHYRAFSLLDLSISFPLRAETVTTTSLALGAGVGPAVVIGIVVVLFVPGPAAFKRMTWGTILRWKIWELNVGLLGFVLAQVTELLVAQGMKNLAGAPRPHALAVCNPDLTSVAQHSVGGYGTGISPRWVLVSQTICQEKNLDLLNDAFRTFPSGHASASWAGFLYLTLFLCSKFSIWFPFLPFHKRGGSEYSVEPKGSSTDLHGELVRSTKELYIEDRQVRYRDEAAAAPTWLLFLAYVPLGAAIYISGSRYFDYYHNGFDVLFGSFVGIVSALIGFHWYHLPLGRSAGWAWSPRSRDRAFGVGVGSFGYVSERTLPSAGQRDLELGSVEAPGPAAPRGQERYEALGSTYGNEPLVTPRG